MSRVLYTVNEISQDFGCTDRQIRWAISALRLAEAKRLAGARFFSGRHKQQIKKWLKANAKTGPLAS